MLVGGAVGTVLRAGVMTAVPPDPAGTPWATFLVNTTGAALLGLLAGWAWARAAAGGSLPPTLLPLVAVGVLGSFTTFSAFALEIALALDGQPLMAIGYAAASIGTGLALAVLGVRGGRRLAHRSGAAA